MSDVKLRITSVLVAYFLRYDVKTRAQLPTTVKVKGQVRLNRRLIRNGGKKTIKNAAPGDGVFISFITYYFLGCFEINVMAAPRRQATPAIKKGVIQIEGSLPPFAASLKNPAT